MLLGLFVKTNHGVLYCGLTGYSGAAKASVENGVVSKIQLLLWANQSRGSHSTGVFGKSLYRDTESADKFVQTKDFIRAINGANTIIGHTRYATTAGKPTVSQAHPFQYENVVGTHNGWVPNYEHVCKSHGVDTPDVDSKSFYEVINKNKNLDVIPELEGKAALAFIFEGDLFLYRRKNRPLHVLFTNDEDKRSQVFYSSDSDHLKIISDHDSDIIYQLVPNVLYRIRNGCVIDEYSVPPTKYDFDESVTQWNWKAKHKELADIVEPPVVRSQYEYNPGSDRHIGSGSYNPNKNSNTSVVDTKNSSDGGKFMSDVLRRFYKVANAIEKEDSDIGSQMDHLTMKTINNQNKSNSVANMVIRDDQNKAVDGAYVFVDGSNVMARTNKQGQCLVPLMEPRENARIFVLTPKMTKMFWTKQFEVKRSQVLEVTCSINFRPSKEKEEEPTVFDTVYRHESCGIGSDNEPVEHSSVKTTNSERQSVIDKNGYPVSWDGIGESEHDEGDTILYEIDIHGNYFIGMPASLVTSLYNISLTLNTLMSSLNIEDDYDSIERVMLDTRAAYQVLEGLLINAAKELSNEKTVGINTARANSAISEWGNLLALLESDCRGQFRSYLYQLSESQKTKQVTIGIISTIHNSIEVLLEAIKDRTYTSIKVKDIMI